MFSPRFRFLPLLIALAAMMIVTAAPAVAGSTMLTPASERVSRLSVADREGVRLELEAYLLELEASTAAFYALPAPNAFAVRAGIDPVGDIRMARAMIPHLTYREIDALRDFYLSNPVALQVPEHIQSLVDRSLDKPSEGRFSGMAVNGSTCSPGTGTPLGITDFYIAEAVALALEVTMEALPTDVITVVGHAIAAVAWGIAKGVALALDGLNATEAECMDAQEGVAQEAFRTKVKNFLDNETNYVSDNELDLGVTTITNNDNTNTQTMLTKMDANTVVITTAIDASATAIINNDNSNRNLIITNDNSNRTMIINNDNTNRDLMVAEMRKIGCDVIRLLNTPEGQRQSSLSSCSGQPAFPYNFPEKSMQVTGAFTSTAIDRDAIDQPVRRPFASTVSLEIHLLEGRLLPTYYLPVARGGMLEEVKALVWSTLDAQRELGIAVSQLAAAESFAQAADVLLNEKSFVEAYRSYAKAYQQLLPQ
jgi:hypothetical protein